MLYHTLAGDHRFLGVPRRIAALVPAARHGASERWADADAAVLELEAWALTRAAARGLLVVDAFGAGETLLIMPRGGHAVLTGERKVVLAGEWHLRYHQRARNPRSGVRKRPRSPS